MRRWLTSTIFYFYGKGDPWVGTYDDPYKPYIVHHSNSMSGDGHQTNPVTTNPLGCHWQGTGAPDAQTNPVPPLSSWVPQHAQGLITGFFGDVTEQIWCLP